MSLFNRSLAKCGKDIVIKERNVKIINGQATEVFSASVKARALVKTVTGVSVFDSTNTERAVTHVLKTPYQAGFTAEKWVNFKDKNIKILTVENCCENDDVLILNCTERGDDSKVINNA